MYNNCTTEALIAQNKQNRKRKRKLYRKRFYYGFVAIVLTFCIFQFIRSTSMNVFKYVTINKQITELESIEQKAKEKNTDLKKQLEIYKSNKGIEKLARNNLKMVGEDEVLVIVKTE